MLHSPILLFLIVGFSRSCSPVTNWGDLKRQIGKAEGPIVFCPFQIRKPSSGKLTVKRSNVTLSCDVPRHCVIGGPGRHFRIKADFFVLEGFVLREATESSIHFAPAPIGELRTHKISDSIFRLNHFNGAVRVNRGNSVRLSNILFQDNQSLKSGGGVAFYGEMLEIDKSEFLENTAMKGGAVFIGQQANKKALRISNTKFISNAAAAEEKGGALSVPSSSTLSLDKGVTGINNDGCEGWFERENSKCFAFPETSNAATFQFGLLSSTNFYGIQVSQGLLLRRIVRSGEPVVYMSKEATSRTSKLPYHSNPDGAHIFESPDGGFVYVSNSEDPRSAGGVYALVFDKRGFIRNYHQLLNGTSRNCNGGSTPWDTWISCEEVPGGRCWQVDPFGNKKPNPIRIGTGEFEAFATDDRDPNNLAFFVTEDRSDGALRRYRPPSGEALSWPMLHNSNATVDYLEFIPERRFRWTSSIQSGRDSALKNYQFTEGIAHHDGSLMFISKKQKQLFRLDMDSMTYTVESTYVKHMSGGGSFGNGPDHLLALPSGILYFTEDGGDTPGIFAYNGSDFLTLLEANADQYKRDETTGIAFSPDGKFLLFCIQERGHCFQASRIDGQPFDGQNVLKWKYAR